MSETVCCSDQLTFWEVGKQTVTVDFSAGEVVSDAGLLAVRRLDRQLGVLREAARRLPDPRAEWFVTHSTEQVLTQRVYQILGGYFDGNDTHQELRHDPLFQTLCDRSPRDGQSLASGSTINRFGHAYTRREAEKPPEERDVPIVVRGDTGFASPEMYDFCEAENLLYALGFSANAVLKRKTQLLLNLAPAKSDLYEEKQQFFAKIDDYQAGSWPHPRTVVAKVEVMPQGANRRFVVTNLPDASQTVYHGFYVRRGDVPERPIGELKNGLAIDRLSSHRFLANAFTLECHLLAYALLVLFREAGEAIPEVSGTEVGTLRERLFKVGAVVNSSVRRIWFHFSSTWPRRELLARICGAVDRFAEALTPAEPAGVPP